MLLRWLRRIFLPRHAAKEKELHLASIRVTLTISHYRNVSQEIQEEIQRNQFAHYFVYDRGDHHASD